MGLQAFRVGVVGGLMRLFPRIPNGTTSTTATGDPDWPFVTPAVEVVEPLVEGGDDIVLQVSSKHINNCHPGLCGLLPGILIDDVRVE